MIGVLCRCHAVCLAAVSGSPCCTDCTAHACRLMVELLPHCAAHRHLHTSKQHTQEHRLSMYCCWDTLGHAIISASDRKKPVSPMQRCRLLRALGMTAHRSLHALWLTAVQAPCCASLRQGSLHAAMAATRTVSWRLMCAWLSKGRLGRWKR